MATSNPSELVRVTDKDTGHHSTIRRSQMHLGNYEELKQDAVDPVTGDVLPPKFKQRAAAKPEKAPAKPRTRKPRTRKTTAAKPAAAKPDLVPASTTPTPDGQTAENKEQS